MYLLVMCKSTLDDYVSITYYKHSSYGDVFSYLPHGPTSYLLN